MNPYYQLINTANYNFQGNEVYVYMLINPTTNLPFYVGKGRGNRAIQHITHRNSKQLYKSNPHKCRTVCRIISNKQMVGIEIVAVFSDSEEASNCEQLLIERYGRRCNNTGILTNITRGGEGNTRDGIPVNQYDMEGKFIKTWKSAKQAARVLGFACNQAITGCCLGRERSYKGSTWTYCNQVPKILAKNTPIYQWTPNGELVNSYKNNRHASKVSGHRIAAILSACKCTSLGRRKLLGGSIWSKANTLSIGGLVSSKKRIMNVTTGVVYPTTAIAASACNVKATNIRNVLIGRQKTTGGYVFAYYEDASS